MGEIGSTILDGNERLFWMQILAALAKGHAKKGVRVSAISNGGGVVFSSARDTCFSLGWFPKWMKVGAGRCS